MLVFQRELFRISLLVIKLQQRVVFGHTIMEVDELNVRIHFLDSPHRKSISK